MLHDGDQEHEFHPEQTTVDVAGVLEGKGGRPLKK